MIDFEQIEILASRLTLQYIAGFFDGEGSITVTKDLSIQVVISQNDEQILLAIAKIFGCGVVSGSKVRRGHKQCFSLRWCGSNAAKVLIKLMPYLIVKQDRAKLALDLQALVGVGRPVPQENKNRRKALSNEIKQINDSHWSRRPASELVN